MIKLFHSYTEIYVKMCHVAASMPENIYLLPCGFLKLLYLSFKAFQSKFHIDTIVFCLKNAEDNSVIFSVGIFNISYLKAHFKTTTTMVSTNFNMNFIFDEWILMVKLLLKKGKLSKLNVIHWQCLPEVVIFQSPHPSQDQQLSKVRLFPLHNVNFSLIIIPPTPFTMLSFDLVNFNC